MLKRLTGLCRAWVPGIDQNDVQKLAPADGTGPALLLAWGKRLASEQHPEEARNVLGAVVAEYADTDAGAAAKKALAEMK